MKTPMRVLIISNYYPPLELGGWEQLTCDVAQRLKERGHAVFVLTSNYCTDWIKEPESDVARLLYLESPDHVHYHPSYILLRRKWERQNINFLTQIVNQFNQDIIFVNGMWNLPVSLVKHAEKLMPGRVVYYMASYWPTERDAHTEYWSNHVKKSKNLALKYLLSPVVKKLLLPETNRSQLLFNRVLFVSNFVRKRIVSSISIPEERTRLVHNGVELESFQPKVWSERNAVIKLLYAGRLSPDKGVHVALESLKIIQEKTSGLNVELSIYGNGPAEYKLLLERMASDLKGSIRVHFQGFVPREKMPEILRRYEVLVLPSIWPEPLSRVVQEAMACGLAVIGTDTGGTPEILKDGINGLIFDAGNAVMLAEKIIEINSDRQRMVAIGKAARETVEARFSLDRMVDDLEANFKEVLRERVG